MSKKECIILVIALAGSLCASKCDAELKLGAEHRVFETGIRGIHTDRTVRLWFGYDTPTVVGRFGGEDIYAIAPLDMDYIVSWNMSSSEAGRTYSVSAAMNPRFSVMASALTDGKNNSLGFLISEDSTYSGLWYTEKGFPKIPNDLVAAGIDFDGYTITRIDATLNSFTLDQDYAADFTRCFLDVEVSVWGTLIPEPATVLLLGMGLVGLRSRRH